MHSIRMHRSGLGAWSSSALHGSIKSSRVSHVLLTSFFSHISFKSTIEESIYFLSVIIGLSERHSGNEPFPLTRLGEVKMNVFHFSKKARFLLRQERQELSIIPKEEGHYYAR